jgi:hypothetical protein
MAETAGWRAKQAQERKIGEAPWLCEPEKGMKIAHFMY